MPGQDYNSTWSFIAAFAGDPNVAVIDWRCIHDTDKQVPAHARRGTLPEWWAWLCQMNDTGYGVFANINALDGAGRELSNVHYIRAHYVDLDNLSAAQNYARVAAAYPAPTFGVLSSIVHDDATGTSRTKHHAYWTVQPYQGNDRFELIQRKLRQVFDGDKAIIDPTRVMRVPGTWHAKDQAHPHLVTCEALPGYGQPTTIEALEAALAPVNVIDGGVGTRHDLGEPSLAAPSLDWLNRALALADPNEMDRGEWIAMTSAIKQAGWTLADPDALFNLWSAWCARYTRGDGNDVGENNKQWHSIRNTELGWQSILHRVPSLKATMMFGEKAQTPSTPVPPAPGMPAVNDAPPPMPEPPPLDCSGEFLTHLEQQEWFKGCYAIEKFGEIMTPRGRFMGSTKFNIAYGGKKFIIDGTGKTVNEAWQAATRSTLWTIPKVDHIRFLPDKPFGEVVQDQLGRRGVNTYIPVKIKTMQGDVTPFTRNMEMMIPDENDRNIIYAYLAHNVKFPGHKIRWAPMIQSTEGVGKGFLMEAMEAIIGEMYCYSPKAQELVNSGSTFNAWMRSKLLIIVNEIKVDERRELIEILKPMITDKRVEIQSKGIDQEMEDNPANWIFFSNFKDAIPVSVNGRRYAIFYSAIQSKADLVARGMTDAYFNQLFKWLYADGAAIVADWLMRHPITVDDMPSTAPATSSTQAAMQISRSPVERMILEAIEDGLAGFRGGWISATMVMKQIKETGIVRNGMAPNTLTTILEGMGYVSLGRAPRAYFQEDRKRPYLFHFAGPADTSLYGRAQGWE
jgi:hypothetical protein